MVFPQDISDIPLTEDILRKPPNFIFGYYEWLAAQGQKVIRAASRVTTGSITMFTVPSNAILFVTGVWGNVHAGTNTSINAGLLQIFAPGAELMGLQTQEFRIDAGQSVGLSSGAVANSVSYPTPLKLEEGDTMILSLTVTGSGVAGRGGFTGFLIRKDLLIFSF